MDSAPTIVVSLPGEGLEWAEATRRIPGSRIQSRVESIHLRDGDYQVTTVVRALGFPAAAIEQTITQLKARYGDAAVDVLEPHGPGGALLRTRLAIEALQSPYVRFLLRFHDQFQQVTASIEAGRLQVRAQPRTGQNVEQDAERILAFVRKLGGSAEVRIDDNAPGGAGTETNWVS